MPKPKQCERRCKAKHMKPLNDTVPSYKQKLQFDTEFKKSVEREKIKPKEIFELRKKNVVRKKKY
jgi:hypothetical protein